MFGDIGKMLKMVGEMKRKMPEMQAKLAASTYTAEAGGGAVAATVNGKVCLTLDLRMYLDAPNPHDAVQIEGDPPLDVVIKGGVAGDQATVAALVNTAPRLLNAPAGLLLVTDLPTPHIA